jgi:hypothetical protein
LESKRGFDPPSRSAAIEIPHPWTRSVNGICFLETSEKLYREAPIPWFAPFEGHLIGCEYDTRRLVRMSLEREDGHWQGAIYPFSRQPIADEATFEGPLVCALAPDGDLYVGNIRDSGWGAGSNTGSIVRLRKSGALPPGIGTVRLTNKGFSIDFTDVVDRGRATDPTNYTISSFRRARTPAYGGEDQDRRVHSVRAKMSRDPRRVFLELDEMREGYVYEFHVRNLTDKEEFFPAEAYYTLGKRRRE